MEREMTFALEAIVKAPHNESPWNYLRGLVKLGGGGSYIARCRRLQVLCQVTFLICSTQILTIADDAQRLHRDLETCKSAAVET